MLLTIAGFQIPVIALTEVVGSSEAVTFAQIGEMKLKLGVIVFTTTFMVIGVAHRPVLGVKVYDPEVVLLMIAGLQLPFMPLLEVVGRRGSLEP